MSADRQIAQATKSHVGTHINVFASHVHQSVVEEWRARVQQPVERAVTDIERIAESPDYTDVGRGKAVEAARVRARQVLQPQRERVAKIRARLLDVERQALPPRPKRTAEDLPELLVEREIRDQLRGKDVLQIWNLCLDAVARNDQQFLIAVEAAPRAFALLTPDYREQLHQLQIDHSPVAETLKALRDDLQLHQGVLEAAEQDIKTAGGDPPRPMAARTAP
jgi:hypothetical protein